MSCGIEVNAGYKGVAAAWLGLDPNFYSRRNRSNVTSDEFGPDGPSVSDKNLENPGKRQSSNQNKTYNGDRNQKRNLNNEDRKTTGLIKTNIEKRLKFNERDWKTEFKSKKRKSHDEDEEESKSCQVKNKTPKVLAKNLPTNSSTSTPQSSSVHQLNTRLLDPSLSKKARKRIRKKLASLTS